MRRRSISLGNLGGRDRVRDEMASNRNTKSEMHLHSEASEQDLKQLYNMRQESVPDDLNQYFGASASIPENTTTTTTTKEQNGYLHQNHEERPSINSTMNRSQTFSNIKKSRSMFDLSRAQALDRFYNFARRLDSYDEGVKDDKLSFYSRELGGEFHFIRFETRRMQNAMDLIKANNLHMNIAEVGATGGGAHKYAADWDRTLGIRMDKQDELDSLVAGMQFVLSTVVGECFTFRPREKRSASESESEEDHNIGAPLEDESDEEESPQKNSSDDESPEKNSSDEESAEKNSGTDEWWWSRKVQRDAVSYSSSYPYLIVTIGTGVSILRVDGPRKHERISGSTIGGGTYWGLIRLLTDVEDFDEAMRLANKGDPSKVDMMVGDIYGKNSGALEKMGLSADLVASSFGKLVTKEDPAKDVKQEDLARALLLMVTINIGQVAFLNAKLHKTPRIYFVGNFLRRNKISQRRLSFAISYWSKGEMEALFLEHEGYFGALGAFLLSQNISHDSGSPAGDDTATSSWRETVKI
jgi:type II pantothenate kinase